MRACVYVYMYVAHVCACVQVVATPEPSGEPSCTSSSAEALERPLSAADFHIVDGILYMYMVLFIIRYPFLALTMFGMRHTLTAQISLLLHYY